MGHNNESKQLQKNIFWILFLQLNQERKRRYMQRLSHVTYARHMWRH
jgi:hypothetical protein